ncbi:hypothetical protein [Methanosarcina sp.]|uniref:hypothetical protein n=1 Tax=Methanosarcina sp. TaxID=2213 RepID=UPI0029895FE1|nr:hypothetical protein [Methanosarcina sp.]MDW5549106.1 hypothetical protein [Methanosarcina sp.]MDW5553160.1 hypothetical protein [Methanosarcina sp.]MDW5559314.1 hypothetical protein [Methanosarcina sp.]
MSANTETLKPCVCSAQGLVRNPLDIGGSTVKEYCNICGRELLEDVLVVDTSLDMKPIKFKDVQGDKSDLICIECAIDSVENPPFVCSRCGQPIEFNEKFYVFREATAKPGGPKVDFKETCLEDKYICSTCFYEVMNPEDEGKKV